MVLSAQVQRQTNKTASEMLSCLKFKSLPSLKLFNKSITTIRLFDPHRLEELSGQRLEKLLAVSCTFFPTSYLYPVSSFWFTSLFVLLMVVNLGASSSSHRINRLSKKKQKRYSVKLIAIPGLRFNYNAISKRKRGLLLQLNNPLKNVEVILWHVLINNSLPTPASGNKFDLLRSNLN